MNEEAKVRFSEFVTARTHVLMRLAYLLTGDQHAAEDLLQTALMKTANRWANLRREDPEAYVRTVMYREQVNRWRRRRHREDPVHSPPDLGYADPSGHADLRLSMREALLRLPPDHRAVLVLRYYEDLSESSVADILDCSIGTVRSRTHRAVTRLRALLPDATNLTIRTGKDLP